MSKLTVVNMKCGGCEAKIKKTLGGFGISDIEIDVENQTISFEGDENVVGREMTKMGYPRADSDEAKSLVKKGHSYVTCAIGRWGPK